MNSTPLLLRRAKPIGFAGIAQSETEILVSADGKVAGVGTSLAVPGRRAQYSGTGPERRVPRAASSRGGGRLLPQKVLRTFWGPQERGRPGAVAGEGRA